MLRRMMKGLNKQEGFTLLEVLVVIAILGIIAALLTPRFLNVMRQARVDTVRASAKQIQMGMERYNFANNHYPADTVIVAGAEYAGLTAAIGTSVAIPAHDDSPFDVASYTSAGPNHDYDLVLTVNNANDDADATPCILVQPNAISQGTLNADGVTCDL